MRATVTFATIAVLAVAMCGTADAVQAWGDDIAWDDMSWWGNTAMPEPVADSQGRSGYWWWPSEPDSNVGDTEAWGNRGIIYHTPWMKPEPPAPPVTPPPPPAPQPKPKRTKIVLNNVLFDFDKATLKPEGKAEIDKLVAEMKKYPEDTVLIEGHTCDIGSDSYNMGLGQRRADAVRSYMLDMGIPASRISTKSFGEEDPAVPNTSPDNRKLNRRAEFDITLGN